MSMNLYLTTTVIVTVFGKEEAIVKRFPLWQTDTEATYAILDQEDREKAYSDWVDKLNRRYNEDVFKEEHKKELHEFLEKYKEWHIEWFYM